MDLWYTPILMCRYTASERWRWAARVEYYSDENDVIIGTNASHGFEVLGYSLNVDYLPAPNVMIRLEAKNMNSKDPEFVKGQNLVNSDAVITSSVSIAF